MKRSRKPSVRVHRPAQGLSIVELLIGIAIGLFILAGAAMVATNQITDNRKLLLETQVQQDMRTAMDIIVRDIRRSGFSFHADRLPPVGGALPAVNPYKPAGAFSSDVLQYTYSAKTDGEDNGSANASDAADSLDFKGFRLHGDIIQVQLGLGNWQPLTDGDVVKITAFDATPQATVIPLSCAAPPCIGVTGCGAQRIVARTIKLTMEGVARHDNRVRRRLETTVRLRNDEVCI